MTRLSVNLNKVALLRNSRDGLNPNLMQFVLKIVTFGCSGITLHPRADKRHVTIDDIINISQLPEIIRNDIIINVESDLREEVINLLLEYKIHQFTVVPVDSVDQKTTERGWNVGENEKLLADVVSKLSNKVRLILFVEPEDKIVRYAHKMGLHGVELHTKCYAESFNDPILRDLEISRIQQMSTLARKLNLSVHLGHNLSLDNLYEIITSVKPDEVSVGHNLISESLFNGLDKTIGAYKKICDA